MGVKTIRYRDYQLVIQPPVGPARRWHILAWPPNKDPPTIMAAQEAEENAIRDAQKGLPCGDRLSMTALR
jgi:hypothetical protein